MGAQWGSTTSESGYMRNRLGYLFVDRVVALHHEIEWPSRSPDLTPCVFFLFGYLTNEIFKNPPQNPAYLRTQITRVCGCLARNIGGGEHVR